MSYKRHGSSHEATSKRITVHVTIDTSKLGTCVKSSSSICSSVWEATPQHCCRSDLTCSSRASIATVAPCKSGGTAVIRTGTFTSASIAGYSYDLIISHIYIYLVHSQQKISNSARAHQPLSLAVVPLKAPCKAKGVCSNNSK